MKNSQILNGIADYLQQFGWTQADGWFAEYGEPACVEGAGKAFCRENHLFWYDTQAREILTDYVSDRFPKEINRFTGRVTLFAWNDRHTKEEVIEVLRSAALIELAKETADQFEKIAVSV